MSDPTKVIELHFTNEPHEAHENHNVALPTATQPQRAIPPPSITVHLGIERVVFLITELQELPELDIRAPEECQMRFRLLPGLLLTSPALKPTPQPEQPETSEQPEKPSIQIVCPLLLDAGTLSGKAQVLRAATENENPFYGLSMFAKILALPEYMNLVPPEISTHLPYGLVKELFPTEAKTIAISREAHSTEGEPASEQIEEPLAQTPVKVNLTLPSGYPLPELYRGKIVRLSLNLATRTGGLALNDRSLMLVNSRSRPSCVHDASASSETPASDYYQLCGTGLTSPVTSALPDFYEDYTEMLDPTAALLARRGIKL